MSGCWNNEKRRWRNGKGVKMKQPRFGRHDQIKISKIERPFFQFHVLHQILLMDDFDAKKFVEEDILNYSIANFNTE